MNESETPTQIQPVAGDEYEVHLSPLAFSKPEPKCPACKDFGPEDGTPCEKCGYTRF